MFQVIPITETKVDWTTYLVGIKNLLNRPITNQLDSNGLKPNSLASYIITLGSIIDQTLTPSEILTQSNLLKHGHYGVACVLDMELLIDLLERSKLSITSIDLDIRNTRLAIMTGTLEDWQITIVEGCSPDSNPEYRALLDVCMLHMEKSGLALLWGKYRKQSLKDKTLILVEK